MLNQQALTIRGDQKEILNKSSHIIHVTVSYKIYLVLFLPMSITTTITIYTIIHNKTKNDKYV